MIKFLTINSQVLDVLLKNVIHCRVTKEKNLKITNVAVMLEGKSPKIDDHTDKIKTSLNNLFSQRKKQNSVLHIRLG